MIRIYFEQDWKFQFETKISLMERDELILTDLALSNMLDVIPWIDNTGIDANDALNRTLVRLYERNLAALN